MLVTLYAHAAANGVHERAPKQASGPDRAKHRLFGACRGLHRADELEHVIGMDAMMDLFYRDHLQAQIAIDYKTEGTAIPPFSLALSTPQREITSRWVSDRI